jgi:hypothetical protein
MSEHLHAAVTENRKLTTLQVVQTSSDLIRIEYFLLPDTDPGKNSNYVAIWQNYDKIPYDQEPNHTQAIEGNSQHGAVNFNVALEQNNYIVGYAVGPELGTKPAQKYGNMCSTAFIPRIGTTLSLLASNEASASVPSEDFQYFFSNLTVGTPGFGSVPVRYEVPPGCLPKNNGAWIGIYRGPASYTEKPEKVFEIPTNDRSAWVGINSKFLAGKEYTAALFLSGYSATAPLQTRMAATVPFVAP